MSVSTKKSPNDVDVVVLPGADYPRDEMPCSEQEARWPFLQFLVAADDSDLEAWSLLDFGTDRNRHANGVIEVLL